MASPTISMGRIVRKNSAASFTFQLPQAGLSAGNISFQVYRHDTTGTHPVVNSSVLETTTPGTYMLTVASGDMVDGGVYYAAVSHDNIAFRLPSWTYAPANEFDKVIADLVALDTHLTNVQTAVQGSITSAVTTLDGAITSAKNAVQTDITTAKNTIQTDVTTAKTFLDGAITTAKTSIESLITAETNALDSAVAAVDSKANAAKIASESLVADFTDSTGRLKTLLDGISSKANDAKVASEAVRDEVGVFDGAFGNLASLLGSGAFSSNGKSLFTRLGELDSSVALLEKEADALSRQNAVLGRLDTVDTQLALKYTLAQGSTDQTALLSRFSTVDSAISAVKAVLDSSLVENAKLIPNVPTSILSPMAEQIMRVSCNVTGPSGTSLAGALEDPDNQEVGLRLYMADGSNGTLSEISSTCLFEDAGKVLGLPSCAGTGTGVPATFKKMKRDGVGQYFAYVKLQAFMHGNLQWDFQIVDSDPSSTPQIFQTVRYTELRRQVSFSAFGAF